MIIHLSSGTVRFSKLIVFKKSEGMFFSSKRFPLTNGKKDTFRGINSGLAGVEVTQTAKC